MNTETKYGVKKIQSIINKVDKDRKKLQRQLTREIKSKYKPQIKQQHWVVPISSRCSDRNLPEVNITVQKTDIILMPSAREVYEERLFKAKLEQEISDLYMLHLGGEMKSEETDVDCDELEDAALKDKQENEKLSSRAMKKINEVYKRDGLLDEDIEELQRIAEVGTYEEYSAFYMARKKCVKKFVNYKKLMDVPNESYNQAE